MVKKTLTLALLCAVGYGAYRLAVSNSGDLEGSDDPALIDGRAWVDMMPEKETDYVNAALFLTPAELGAFHRGSQWEGRYELFELKRDKGTIRLRFPQSGRATQLSFTVKTCKDRRPFDLCLDLSANPWGGPRRYYGFSNPDEEKKELAGVSRELHGEANGR